MDDSGAGAGFSFCASSQRHFQQAVFPFQGVAPFLGFGERLGIHLGGLDGKGFFQFGLEDVVVRAELPHLLLKRAHLVFQIRARMR